MKTNRYAGLLPVLFLFCFSAQAQVVGSWKSYLAYQNAELVTETPNHVFAVYDGALLSYSMEDKSVQTYSLEDGLHDANIRFLNYCPEVKALLIVYANSNIDIFMGKNNVYNLSYIKDNTSLTNKIVNNVEIKGRYAYLATGYGIVTVDLQRKEIKSTYNLGVNTTAVCEWNGYMYAATADGLRRGLLSANLLDKGNWEYVPSFGKEDNKNITKMVVYNDQLIFYDTHNTWRLTPDRILNLIYSGFCKQLTLLNGQLGLAVQDGVFFYGGFDKRSFLPLNSEYKSIALAHATINAYWIAYGSQGVTGLVIKEQAGTNELEYETLVPGIKVNSPLRNMAFHLTFAENKLLVTGGSRNADRFLNPGTFMVYENGKWQNMDEKAVSAKIGFPCLDMMSAVADPLDPNHYYVSSWGEGVYEFQDTTLLKLYSYDNSSLMTMSPETSPNKPHYVRTDGMVYDRNNNLYILNQGVQNGLSILSSTGKWNSLYYKNLAGAASNQIIITRDNKKWINMFRGTTGILVLDDKGVIDKPAAEGDTYYASEFSDQEGRNIASNYYCLAEDLNGIVWVGTGNGPITFSSAEQVERKECTRPTGVDQYGAGYYLLEGQRINTIAVDGANRKWIGTEVGGVFVIDQTNGTHVENFNMSNSNIISNTINSIAINGKTGEVFIATDRGICSYRSDAIDGKTDYSEAHAFPNPVRPASNNQVIITGLMQNSRIKITDLGGNLMKEAVSNGGQYTWNCTNPKGEIVKAGIYLVFATLPDGSQGVVTKIMVIK